MGTYIDLQINGYAGVDFNDPGITPEQIHSAAQRLKDGGTAHILATIITAIPECMTACLRKLVKARENDPLTKEVITGFHIEGPFISSKAGYVGAHPPAAVCVAEQDMAASLLEAGDGIVRLFTLAPECDPDGKVSQFLAGQGILVAAGHTDASLDELKMCIDKGLSLFTHLGNGCPIQMHRHDNIIQRALSLHRYLHYGLIADGTHLPLHTLRNFIELAGIDRCFVVTDAMSAAGLGPGRYTLGEQVVEVDESQVAWSADHSYFVGSAATMRRCVEILKQAGFNSDDIQNLTRENPAKQLGIISG